MLVTDGNITGSRARGCEARDRLRSGNATVEVQRGRARSPPTVRVKLMAASRLASRMSHSRNWDTTGHAGFEPTA